MKKTIVALACAGSLALSGCMTMNQQRQVAGGVAGGTIGLITAKALDASDEWTIVSTLAGATAGSMVARNTSNDRCAYKTTTGEYRVAPCP
ncbi:glucose-6-phosphate isomerase [Roseovarius salinarum]|uniref:glucose-6-phosphate isomerase n=1 Tax=Roseovarius salinarum TaxID=1981892 RepID=UPI000C346D7D|nr:glucose-6-phosphate isomerase [Roseovarius salinarum]